MEPIHCRSECDYLKVAHDLFETIELKEHYLKEHYLKEHYLKGLNVWIGASKRDETSKHMSNLYSCVLMKLGVNILNKDFSAILNDNVGCDVLLMFTFTPGSSARAIEVVITSKFDKSSSIKDKLHVYMPHEYKDGYISRTLADHLIAGKLIHKEKLEFEQLDKKIFRKCIVHLVDTVRDKEKEMEITFKPRIAILTALPKEFAMMKKLLSDLRQDKSLKDKAIQFPHGRIGANDVVLAMSGMGNNLSSAIATAVYDKYPSIEYTFIVGIAGGIPDLENPEEHVSLGDIVLCDEKGVLQYDMSKTKIDGKEYNFSPRAPHSTLIRNSRLYVEDIGTAEYKYWEYLDDLLKGKSLTRPETAILDESPWIEGAKVDFPPVPIGYNKDKPRIHFGPIASANTVVKDIELRTELKKEFKAKAIEMESSGVADAAWLNEKHYFVMRGICDYANPNKNNEWQEYAAAAFTREIIEKTLSN